MPFPDFFQQFGIFSEFGFLSPEFCEQSCQEIKNATAYQGTIWNPEMGTHVKEDFKKRKEMVNISAQTVSLIEEKLFSLKPQIEKHFDIELTRFQPLKFVCYEKGDFYARHTDISTDSKAPRDLHERKISVIIFLNQEAEKPKDGDFCGGNLTFYGLLDGEAWQNVGLPLNTEKGLLVAFRPEMLHEVTPVTHGKRFTITTWYI